MSRNNVQEKDWYCGPACIQRVLALNGIQKSQDAIAREVRTTKEEGTPNREIAAFFERMKWSSIVNREHDLDLMKKLLKQKYAIILNYWYEPDNTGHFALVKEVRAKEVVLWDPVEGKEITFTHAHLKTIWTGTEKDAGWFIAAKKAKSRR